MSTEKCPLCEGLDLKRVIYRPNVIVHQNLLCHSYDTARKVTTGDLDIVICKDCGFLFNKSFDLSLLSYGKDYDNNQTCSDYFNFYLDDLVKYLIDEKQIRQSNIIEVGCGQGQFIHKLITYPGSENTGYGFDPSYIGPLSMLDGKLNFRRCYYDDGCMDISADIVICRHVIEHVPEPLQLLKSIRAALNNSPNARVFFETPCAKWILENFVFWDFFYEHCSLFSTNSLAYCFNKAGFKVENVRHIFGGQYLWIEAVPSENFDDIPLMDDLLPLAEYYSLEEENLIADWKIKLSKMKMEGRIALWGAGAKGVTLANLIDPDNELIDCIVDLNPNKQEKFIPGTGHAIVSPECLKERGVKNIILMNGNYYEENKKIIDDNKIGATLFRF